MTAELSVLIPVPEVATDAPLAAAEYNRLISHDARLSFGTRIETERSLLDIERATVQQENSSLDAQRNELLSGRIPDYEIDMFQDKLRNEYTELLEQEDQLRMHGAFTNERENRWNYGGNMLYDRQDPAVAELIGGLLEGAETSEQPFYKIRILCGWRIRLNQRLLLKRAMNHLNSL